MTQQENPPGACEMLNEEVQHRKGGREGGEGGGEGGGLQEDDVMYLG